MRTVYSEKARECLVVYIDPGKHDNLVSVWRLETIDKISKAIEAVAKQKDEEIAQLKDSLFHMTAMRENVEKENLGRYEGMERLRQEIERLKHIIWLHHEVGHIQMMAKTLGSCDICPEALEENATND